jgi:hypothetical protein
VKRYDDHRVPVYDLQAAKDSIAKIEREGGSSLRESDMCL